MRSHDLIALIFIDFDQWYTDIPKDIAFHKDVCDFIDIQSNLALAFLKGPAIFDSGMRIMHE